MRWLSFCVLCSSLNATPHCDYTSLQPARLPELYGSSVNLKVSEKDVESILRAIEKNQTILQAAAIDRRRSEHVADPQGKKTLLALFNFDDLSTEDVAWARNLLRRAKENALPTVGEQDAFRQLENELSRELPFSLRAKESDLLRDLQKRLVEKEEIAQEQKQAKLKEEREDRAKVQSYANTANGFGFLSARMDIAAQQNRRLIPSETKELRDTLNAIQAFGLALHPAGKKAAETIDGILKQSVLGKPIHLTQTQWKAFRDTFKIPLLRLAHQLGTAGSESAAGEVDPSPFTGEAWQKWKEDLQGRSRLDGPRLEYLRDALRLLPAESDVPNNLRQRILTP